jgi:hypothetical protein
MKKTFSKFFATAAAVSMLASVSAVVNADEAALEYATEKCEHGVVITGVKDADEVNEIVIPDEINGEAVVGVADFAFADLDSLSKIWVSPTITLEHTGNAAFVTKSALWDYLQDEIGAEATKDEVVTYVANKVYGEKEWTAEELADVEAKINTKAALAGVEFTEDMTEAEIVEAIAVMLQNQDKMQLAETTADKLAIWETTVTYDCMAVVILKGTEMDEYFANKEENLGMVVEINGVTTLAGDANKDGIINVRDAAAIAAALANGKVEELPGNGDYNADDVVNVRDAAAIAAALANGTIAK